MTYDRFSNLSLLYIERDLTHIINSEEFLNIFAQKSRRLILILIISYLKCYFFYTFNSNTRYVFDNNMMYLWYIIYLYFIILLKNVIL